MTTMSFSKPVHSVGENLLMATRQNSTVLWWTICCMMVGTAICLVLQQFDPRLINGANVWMKPAKFFVSLAVQFATVAWALQFLPTADRQSRGVRWSIVAMFVAGWAEIAYIVFRASRAEASHFNTATPDAALLYAIMGVGAVTLTVTAAYIGYRIWKHRRDGLWTEAAAMGLLVGSLLGTVAGAYLSSQTGHSIGGDPTDATGTGFFSWSTTGGDLRIAHFVGLHAAQIIPIAALSGQRRMVWFAAMLCVVLTAVTFALALGGIPLFRA